MTPQDRDKPRSPAVDLRRTRQTDVRQQVVLDRLETIIRLRSARVPWRTVAEQVGLSHEHARRIYHEHLAVRAAELGDQVDVHREEVALVLDAILRRAMVDVLASTDSSVRYQASSTALRCIKQYVDLYGLAAPRRVEARVDVTHTTPIDEELARLTAHLGFDPGGDE